MPFIFPRLIHVTMPDFFDGFLRGIGLGIMLLFLVHPKFRKNKSLGIQSE
jgi:hypothetical protein